MIPLAVARVLQCTLQLIRHRATPVDAQLFIFCFCFCTRTCHMQWNEELQRFFCLKSQTQVNLHKSEKQWTGNIQYAPTFSCNKIIKIVFGGKCIASGVRIRTLFGKWDQSKTFVLDDESRKNQRINHEVKSLNFCRTCRRCQAQSTYCCCFLFSRSPSPTRFFSWLAVSSWKFTKTYCFWCSCVFRFAWNRFGWHTIDRDDELQMPNAATVWPVSMEKNAYSLASITTRNGGTQRGWDEYKSVECSWNRSQSKWLTHVPCWVTIPPLRQIHNITIESNWVAVDDVNRNFATKHDENDKLNHHVRCHWNHWFLLHLIRCITYLRTWLKRKNSRERTEFRKYDYSALFCWLQLMRRRW